MFKVNCNCRSPRVFKIEADYHADPIWCYEYGFNLDIDDFPLSEKLKEELYNWIKRYKRIPAQAHNKSGQYLTEKTQKELGLEYDVIFKPIK